MRVFQKGVHRIPTLALYKSLLKLSSSSSLEIDLSKRIQKEIRNGFQENKFSNSARTIKHLLIKAFTVTLLHSPNKQTHATIEKAIQGDFNAITSLLETFPPPKPKQKRQIPFPPKPILPPLPRVTPSSPSKRFIKAPTIRYATNMIPVLIIPNSRNLVFHHHVFRKKLNKLRSLTESFGAMHLLIYHAELERAFLENLARQVRQNWGFNVETGVREMKAMAINLGNQVSEETIKEDVRVELALRKWVKDHPGARYWPYGIRMPRRLRREVKHWRTSVETIKRVRRRQIQRWEFMEQWNRGLGRNSQVTTYVQDDANKVKRKAKRRRQIRMLVRATTKKIKQKIK
jgi:hypothetical protein